MSFRYKFGDEVRIKESGKIVSVVSHRCQDKVYVKMKCKDEMIVKAVKMAEIESVRE